MENREKGHLNSPKSVKSDSVTASTSQADADLILPSLSGLRNSRHLQSQVDQRLQELHGPTTLYFQVQVNLEDLMIICPYPSGYQVSIQ